MAPVAVYYEAAIRIIFLELYDLNLSNSFTTLTCARVTIAALAVQFFHSELPESLPYDQSFLKPIQVSLLKDSYSNSYQTKT